MSLQPKQKYIQQAFQKLQNKKGYTQAAIVKKMTVLGFQSTTTTFNKIIKNKPVGLATLNYIWEGIQAVIKKELCLELKENLEWVFIKNGQTKIIRIETLSQQGFAIHPEGRLDIKDKVRFFSTAQDEIIEFGITLHAFSNYFMSQRESVFKQPIRELLKKGVNINCFLLDPNWSGTHFYFEDRHTSIKEGLPGVEKIKSSLRKLKIIQQEFVSQELKGKFKIFTYRHIPQNYFLAIDSRNSKQGKMMTSNYLYGQKRAYCPVMEFTRLAHPVLFRRYLDSLNKITRHAKLVDFEGI